ncbi:hypothetical protein PINS_up009190 [Pythium insidiosum]|nr:hypothetical protein PINS_up009190 [Pythium insidiosum]
MVLPPEAHRGPPRYAPWLRRALKISQDTERFWTRGGERSSLDALQPEKREKVTAPAARADDPETIDLWAAIADDRAVDVQRIIEMQPSRLTCRREGASDRDGGGVTVLHEAAFHGAVHVTALVLHAIKSAFPMESQRAMVNAIDTVHSQTTPLIAACRGCKGFAAERNEIIRLLVNAGADVQHQDAHGDNALHWCARTSNMAALRLLLKITDAAASAVVAENHAGNKVSLLVFFADDHRDSPTLDM